MLTKLGRAENAIVRVVLLNGDTNIGCLRFEEHLAMNGVTGSSGQLMMDEEEGAAMVNIDGTTSATIA